MEKFQCVAFRRQAINFSTWAILHLFFFISCGMFFAIKRTIFSICQSNDNDKKKYTILNWHCFLFIRFRVLRMCSITESWQMRLATAIMGAIKMDVFASKCYFAYSKLTKNVYDFAWPKSHFSPTEQTRAFLNEIQIS